MSYYSGKSVAQKMFEASLERQNEELLKAVDAILNPFVEEGRRALEEFLEGERNLQRETFSRN